jgi:hypothetical protein
LPRQQRFCAYKNHIPVGLKADAQFRFLIGKGLLNLIVFYVPEDLLTCPASPNEETLFGYISTSGFWPRVRARALRAPVFLGSLPRPTGRCAPPRPSQLRCSTINKK